MDSREERQVTAAPRPLDAQSRVWVDGLTGTGQAQQDAIGLLHQLMLRVARAEANRRRGVHGIQGKELEDLAQQAADDAVVSILRTVGNFRGDSRFTTWACAFAIHEISDKFGRHAWRRDGVQLDEAAWDRLPDTLGGGPEAVAESRAMLSALREAVDQELTDHQRYVFVAIVVSGIPLDVLAVELGSNRNAIYKTMFDARRKLRSHLVAHGHLETGRHT